MTPATDVNSIRCPAWEQCKGHPMFHRAFAATPMAVRQTLTDIRRRFKAEIDADVLGRLELVLAEVMNNVAKHGGRQTRSDHSEDSPVRTPFIHLCVIQHDGALSCAITDDGISLPQDCVKPRSLPDLEGPDLPEGGFGWFLIQDLTQELCYYREDMRNYLAFRVPVTSQPEEKH